MYIITIRQERQPARSKIMTSTEKAKVIREALKESGFNQKQISVKNSFQATL